MYPRDVTPKPISNTESLPEGFVPLQFPIIGRHFYGIEPPPPCQHISVPLARVIDRLRVVDDTEDESA